MSAKSSKTNSKFSINAFFDNLVEGIQNGNLQSKVNLQDVNRLLSEARRVFMSQPIFLRINAPLIVCGDLHGQFNDVIRMFASEGFPHVRNYLFLGDYVDRGTQSVELILFMFACKIRYPRNFFMLRGNHETASINNVYGFNQSVRSLYQSQALYESFQRVFDCMPLSALISSRILCMHGGLSPQLLEAPRLDILNSIQRPLTDKQINQTVNPLAVDLLWADPDVNVRMFDENHRGIGHTFGQAVIDKARQKFGLDLIIRAHQVVMDGHEFFDGQLNSGLITLFTAPHYCGMYDNSGAVVKISADLGVSFKVFQPDFMGQRDNSNPLSGTQTGRVG